MGEGILYYEFEEFIFTINHFHKTHLKISHNSYSCWVLRVIKFEL